MPHLDALFRAAVAICGQRQQAQDLVQMTYLKALQSFGSFRAGSNCKAWMLSILRNSWIDLLRRKKFDAVSLPLDGETIASRASGPDASAPDREDLLENFSDPQVIRALRGLADDQRLTLYLVDVEELDYKDVAEILQISAGTVKSRVSRARAALKDKLQGHARELGFPQRQQ